MISGPGENVIKTEATIKVNNSCIAFQYNYNFRILGFQLYLQSMDKSSIFFDKDLNYLRKSLIEHPLYNSMNNLSDIVKFMEVHVFAVWDFMSLVKNLQMNLTCINTPWIPSENSLTARLINEIVWGEETDINENNIAKSHFEMYLDSMNDIGANTDKIELLIGLVKE